MTVRQAAFLSVLVTMCSITAAAQRCAPPDTTAEWFTRQRAWLSDAKHDWSDDLFRSALTSAASVDASRPLRVQVGVQKEGSASTVADTAILRRLRTLAATRGSTWPVRAVVGAAGVRSLWIIAQNDTALQRTVLHRMMESGPDEALAADVAVLEDRVRLQSGRKQLYGSQLRMVGGRFAPAPIEDSAHVDMRRDAAGLPPLRQAMCTLMSS
ncbi:MAG TPA: DUF6624 domain-containing protein [Gemmatimonadaceae bacterium]|nr:DUF6624 domain-containing protein [Gemmatimonadaceae bacterium]